METRECTPGIPRFGQVFSITPVGGLCHRSRIEEASLDSGRHGWMFPLVARKQNDWKGQEIHPTGVGRVPVQILGFP
jgi:hypothetical protein